MNNRFYYDLNGERCDIRPSDCIGEQAFRCDECHHVWQWMVYDSPKPPRGAECPHCGSHRIDFDE
jgi:hypothetical protein